MRPPPAPPSPSSATRGAGAGGDFGILFSVCLKMFLRPSTRSRLVGLLVLFLALMAFNTAAYTGRILRSEAAKREVLEQRAFKVFFLRARSPRESLRLIQRQGPVLASLGARWVAGAFIYQNVLYLNFPVPSAGQDRPPPAGAGDLTTIADLFDLRPAWSSFGTAGASGTVRFKNVSLRYGGPPAGSARGPAAPGLKADLRDIAVMLRGPAHGKRLEISNRLMERFVAAHATAEHDGAVGLNPWMTRVETVVPLNLLHLWRHLGADHTADIFDWERRVVFRSDALVEVRGALLKAPGGGPAAGFPYLDSDIYPRYLPVAAEDLVACAPGGLLGEPLRIDRSLSAWFEEMHTAGHHLYSREKLYALQTRVARINADIRATHWSFYWTDLAAGLGFPFMMSLFAFVHLKAELAFLLMFKDRLRQIRLIFWLLPVSLMAAAKAAALIGCLLVLPRAADGVGHLIGPLLLSLAAAAASFWPLNRWCFAPFAGRRIELYALHRGR